MSSGKKKTTQRYSNIRIRHYYKKTSFLEFSLESTNACPFAYPKPGFKEHGNKTLALIFLLA